MEEREPSKPNTHLIDVVNKIEYTGPGADKLKGWKITNKATSFSKKEYQDYEDETDADFFAATDKVIDKIENK